MIANRRFLAMASALCLACAGPSLASESSGRSVARTSFDGPALELDFPGLYIGVAEYDEGPTGGTVFLFSKPVLTAVDTRGGSPGTTVTDVLRLSYDEPFVRAIAFAGGSSYGLAFAGGVTAEIKAQTANAGHWENIPVVPGAIIFDLGGRRLSIVTPDFELGGAAVRAARQGRFLLGPRGAGRFAMQGSYFGDRVHSGQGGAFRKVGPTKIAVFTVVNAAGAIVDRGGRLVRCRDEGGESSHCPRIAESLATRRTEVERASSAEETSSASPRAPSGLTTNTTISLVVTNQKLPLWALQRLAVQVHTSMARAIQPLATANDGDTLFAVTTAEVENPALGSADLGAIASEVAWDAILSSVPPVERPPAETRVTPAAEDLDRLIGGYEFAPEARARVTRDGGRLLLLATDDGGLYLPTEAPVELIPQSAMEFVIDSKRRDRVRFEADATGEISTLTLNPGSWALTARRVGKKE